MSGAAPPAAAAGAADDELLETKRDSAQQCVELAHAALRDGQIERGRRLLERALRLYPLPEARALLVRLNAATAPGAAPQRTAPRSTPAAHSPPVTPTAPASAPAAAPAHAASAAPKREYSPSEHAEVRRILASKTHYEVLKVERDADETVIRKSYRRLALVVHPDRNGAPGAEDAFKRVAHAFECLSDAQKRAYYNEVGHDDPQQAAAAARAADAAAGRGMYYRAGPGMGARGDPFATGFDDLFDMLFNRRGAFSAAHRAGRYAAAAAAADDDDDSDDDGADARARAYARATGQRPGSAAAAAAAARRRAAAMQTPPPLMARVVQFLPLIMLALVLLTSMWAGSSRASDIALAPSSSHPVERHTTSAEIYRGRLRFYVRDAGAFGDAYPEGSRERAALERDVVTRAQQYLSSRCHHQRLDRQQSMQSARLWGSKQQLEEAFNMGTPACDALERLHAHTLTAVEG